MSAKASRTCPAPASSPTSRSRSKTGTPASAGRLFHPAEQAGHPRPGVHRPPDPLGKKELRDAIYSLRKNDLFEESKLAKALDELQALFKSRGYFNAQVSPRVSLNKDRSGCTIQFVIASGQIARIRQLQVDVDDGAAGQDHPRLLPRTTSSTSPTNSPSDIEKTRKLLKKHLYYFPEIKVQEDFLNPERSALDVTVDHRLRLQVPFRFPGHGRPDVADRRRLGAAGL